MIGISMPAALQADSELRAGLSFASVYVGNRNVE
jgi:hypothetical protein